MLINLYVSYVINDNIVNNLMYAGCIAVLYPYNAGLFSNVIKKYYINYNYNFSNKIAYIIILHEFRKKMPTFSLDSIPCKYTYVIQ